MTRSPRREATPLGADSEFFFSLSLDMLCIADGEGHFIRVNPAFETTLGYSAEELLSRPFLDFVHPDDVPATLAEVDKLAQGQSTLSFRNRYRCKDGSYKWLSWRSRPTPDGRQVAIARDITEEQRVLQHLHDRELEAQAANRAKSMFLAAMSHEIRTPLIGVIGMLELLGRSALEGQQRRQFNIVQQSAHSLLEIIGDILDYSKIEAGKVQLAPETASVRDLVSRVVAGFSATAESKGLQLTQVIDPGVAAAHVVDDVRLLQILRNFVGNSIKFTERGSVVVAVNVTGEAEGRQALSFTVSDTGIGITAERLSRLFEPFTQGDVGIARRFGGTGLGLVICRRLADLMGGTVRAESEPGWGTVMVLELRLPVGDPKDIAAVVVGEEPAVATRPCPTREQAEREGSLLLLAEDHPVNREVLTGQLNLAGFFVDTALDGTSALQKFGANRYGLVLTDLHMPGLDGFQLTAAIREFELSTGRPRTPIVALTADVLREHVERCLGSGMDDYLSKPVTIRQLVEKLRQWLPSLEWQSATGAEASGSAAPAAVPVERSVLEQITGRDAGKVRQFLAYYCKTSVDDLASLSEAQRQGDEAVARVAHRIKGAALMVGAHEVAGIAARLERAAREVPAFDASELSAQLRRAVARVDAYAAELER